MNKKKYLLLTAAAALLGSAVYVLWLPDVRPLKTKNPKETSFMKIKEARAKAQGKKLPRNFIWTPWSGISDNLKYAVMISEDHMFYRHEGVNWEMTWEAAKADLKNGRLAKGGSTITQQLARNLYLSPSKNPLRKLKEYLIARRLEKELGKRRIFEIYLNVAEWGKGIYGAEAASRAYFGHGADVMSPEEAAALAAVLPSPRRYDPLKDSRFMRKRKGTIIARMRASGYLPDEKDDAELDASMEEVSDSSAPVTQPLPAETTGQQAAPL